MSEVENIRTLYPRMIEGDIGATGVFEDHAMADSPLLGRKRAADFLAETRSWLVGHDARTEEIHTVVTPHRVIHELIAYLELDGAWVEVPIMLVADVRDHVISDLRVYHSTWPLTNTHTVRSPLMVYDLDERPPEPVGTYHAALAAADAETADSVFEPDGTVREPAGGPWVYGGADRTEWYRRILSIGPIVLHLGTITDDGETVVYEYMVDRWGPDPVTPQAGAAAYQRGPSGKLCSARIYDDVEPPAGLTGE